MAPGVALSWQMWVRWRLLVNVVLHIRNLEGEMIRRLWVQPQQLQRGQRESHLANSRLTVELKSTQRAPSIPRSSSLEEPEASKGQVLAGGSLKNMFLIPFHPETKNNKRFLEGS